MNKIKVKRLYEEIEFLKAILEEQKNNPNFDKYQMLTQIEQRKRKIRSSLAESEWGDDVSYYEDPNGESYRIYYDEYFNSREEMEEWMEETHRRGQPQLDYDWSPTGLWFISVIRVAHIKDDRYRVMIQRNIDV